MAAPLVRAVKIHALVTYVTLSQFSYLLDRYLIVIYFYVATCAVSCFYNSFFFLPPRYWWFFDLSVGNDSPRLYKRYLPARVRDNFSLMS